MWGDCHASFNDAMRSIREGEQESQKLVLSQNLAERERQSQREVHGKRELDETYDTCRTVCVITVRRANYNDMLSKYITTSQDPT